MSGGSSLPGRVLIGVFLAVLITPVIVVAMNAFAGEWAGTLLPEEFSSKWIAHILQHPMFRPAVINSLLLATGTLLLSLSVCVPAFIVAHCYFPRLDRLMSVIVVLPYALPGIVLALGLLRTYSGAYGVTLNDNPAMLCVFYVPLGASLYYVPMKSSLRGLNVDEIFSAGAMLGAGRFTVIRRVILPCVSRSILIGAIMNFTLIISEFVYANLLVGSRFPTIQIFINMLRNNSSHLMSVVITTYFLIILIATFSVVWMISQKSARQ